MSDATEPNPDIQKAIDQDAADAAEEIKEETTERVDTSTVSSITELRGQWERYFANQGHERMKKITEMASRSKFTIALQIPTGKKVKNPLTDETEPEYQGWENKTFERDKISQANWLRIEKMRAKFNAEKDPVRGADLYAKLYEGLAYLYLKMKPDDFRRADWEEMKTILDACNHRTIYGLPSRQGTSNSSSIQGGLG